MGCDYSREAIILSNKGGGGGDYLSEAINKIEGRLLFEKNMVIFFQHTGDVHRNGHYKGTTQQG